jgi:hypothetical protein
VNLTAKQQRFAQSRQANDGRFYVYQLVDSEIVLYIGKGSGNRLYNQMLKFRLNGQIIARFRKEKDAYAFEVDKISELKPSLNRHKGGNGSHAHPIRKPRKSDWEIEFEAIGSKACAARLLLRFSAPDPSVRAALLAAAHP